MVDDILDKRPSFHLLPALKEILEYLHLKATLGEAPFSTPRLLFLQMKNTCRYILQNMIDCDPHPLPLPEFHLSIILRRVHVQCQTREVIRLQLPELSFFVFQLRTA